MRQVSKIGYGCMGLTGVYNAPVPEDAGVAVIRRAFDAGVTFFDTADAYGPHTNEILLGKVKSPFSLQISICVSVLASVGGCEIVKCWIGKVGILRLVICGIDLILLH